MNEILELQKEIKLKIEIYTELLEKNFSCKENFEGRIDILKEIDKKIDNIIFYY